MFEFIEKVVYINLEHRTDRKQQIEDVLKIISPEKVIRFNAIKHAHGGVGCTLSHIAVLEMAIAHGWKNYLVVEDDAVWSNFKQGYSLLEQLIQNSYDVLVLGSASTIHNNYKLVNCQTTTAYIVNQSYYTTLLSNFKEGLSLFLSTGIYHQYAIDQYWKRLQSKDTWYVVVPSLLVQRPGYSDIEKKNTNYIKEFA
jgi:glycosyl transferase family 25